MIPLDEALDILDSTIGSRRLPSERLAVGEAMNRILTADQTSTTNLPPFDKSAVDGFAVPLGDLEGEFRLTGTVRAGDPGSAVLEPQTTVKVMTGAPVPAGTVRVIMVEDATVRDGIVRFNRPSERVNICRQAEDVAVGQTVVTAGTRLGPLHIANLVGCGIHEVPVARSPQLAIRSTGDELVDSVEALRPGRIMDTNGPLLCALAERWGVQVNGPRIIPDDKFELERALTRALKESDAVVLSGGVSAGDYDFVPKVIEHCGLTIHFDRVALKPGLPVTFASCGERMMFGLPGNPVAVYVTFHLFVLRALALLSGKKDRPPERTVRLDRPIARRSATRTEYCPCRLLDDGTVERVSYHGSAHLAALMQADGFAVIPRCTASLPAGAEVAFATFTEGLT
ncbi:MAG: molybdopterin molybdotransferase MoeA [Phycisphaerae bacterium]|jgi:molybdopterin molybdotransferase